MKDKTRSFGILYQGGDQGFDIDFFKSEFAKYGGKLAPNGEAEFTYPPGTSQADAGALAQEQMPTLMAKLKDSGVTTIIEVLDAAVRHAARDARGHLGRVLPRVADRQRRPHRRRRLPGRPPDPRADRRQAADGATPSG